jgi:hypothetical protein
MKTKLKNKDNFDFIEIIEHFKKHFIKNIKMPFASKKGYFFLMDGIFAIVILVIGFILITANQPRVETELNAKLISQNIIDIMSSIKIEDICNECMCTIQKISENCESLLVSNNKITLLDYMGELYFRNNIDLANITFTNITNDLYRHDLYEVELIVDDKVIKTDITKDKSRHLISRKKVLFGYFELDDGTVEFWGPYMSEINVWEK